MIVSLESAKEHLNISLDGDDALITGKLAAAQSHIERMLGYAIETTHTTVPEPLIEAVLMLAGHWYENREATLVGVNAQSLPFGVDEIVREYRGWSF